MTEETAIETGAETVRIEPWMAIIGFPVEGLLGIPGKRDSDPWRNPARA